VAAGGVRALEGELAREVGTGHPLQRIKAISVGRRIDSDDVLFFLAEHSQPLAVVHLTWASESSAQWPVFYSSIDDGVERCMKPDHNECSEA
jgi:hypothetical protein